MILAQATIPDPIVKAVESALLDSPAVWIISIAAFGVFALLTMRMILQWRDVSRIKGNGGGHSHRSLDPQTLLLQEIVNESKGIRSDMAIVYKTTMASEKYSREVWDAALGPQARTADGGFKWFTGDKEQVSLLEKIVEKQDSLIKAVTERGCPYRIKENGEEE